MTIKEIAKKALASFKNRGYIFTPKEYEEVFCKIARQHGVIIKDCNKLSKFISKLDKNYQVLAHSYNIKTLDELIIFLINYLNREGDTKDKENLNQLFLYTKRALDVITILPIVKSQKIAIKHLDFLKPYIKRDTFEKLRSEWIEFLNNFDNSVVKKGAKIAHINSNDALEVIEALINKLENEDIDLSHLVDAIIYALTPSYAPFINDDVVILKKEIKENPKVLLTKAFAEELKVLTDKRIKEDKEELRKKLKDLDRIAERLSLKILKILKKTDGSAKEIKNITIEIENFTSNEEFEIIKQKLLNIAVSLDKELDNFSQDMKEESEEVRKLKEKIRFLEEKVEKLEKEVKTDFLTNMSNKKAIEEELKKQDSAYNRYGINYSVVFFDIDHFKYINDTYGHDAGDVVLKSLGLLFKRYTRDVDTVGRFGGEEFVAILPNTPKAGAKRFAEKLREIIEKTKFMYKNTRIKVSVSAGVASRDEVKSKEELLKKADERLYLAKENGRNRVCAEDKCDES